MRKRGVYYDQEGMCFKHIRNCVKEEKVNKMKGSLKVFGIVLLLVLSLIGSAVSVSAVPVSIDWVKIDGDIVQPGEVVKVERGASGDTDVEIKIKFAASADAENLRAEAVLQGYEHKTIRGETEMFDVSAGQKFTETFALALPDDLETGRYTLKILVSDARNPSLFSEAYTFDVDAPRHAVTVEDVVLSGTEVPAGSALYATVRLENKGDRDEEVKVTISLPGLEGAPEASDYLDELETGKKKSSEELYLRIPRCAELGKQTLVITAEFNDGRDSVTHEETLNIVDGGLCDKQSKTVITLGAVSASAKQGETVKFPVTLSNAGTSDKTFTLETSGADWASVEISPLNVLTVAAGESKTAFVHVTPNSGVEGTQSLTLAVKSGDETLKQMSLSVDVEGNSGLLTAVVVALIIIIVVLVVVGIVVGVSRARSEDDEETTYY